jgi:hypothetical protein
MEQLIARNIVAVVTALAIIIVVGLGFVIRSAANSASQAQDLVTIVQGVQKAFSNQNYQYGNGTIPSSILINGNKIDPNIVSGTTIQTRWQATITLTGTGSAFSATVPSVPYGNCPDILQDQSLGQYITSIGVSGGTMRTPPVAPATAVADCGSSGTVDVVVNFQGHP